jgi:bifunctional oligoribonuclease and PAP phosphatase NrnA
LKTRATEKFTRSGAHATKETMTDLYQQTIDILTLSKRVLITTHVRPDGDALGTTAALVLGLRKKGIESEVLLLSHLPRKYSFIFHEYAIPHQDVENAWPDGGFPFDRFDALLVADTGTWSQLPGIEERIRGWNKPKLVLDHHLTQQDWADVKLVDTEAAAAAEVAAELLDAWGIEFDRPIATALYLGVASDTGWFQFSNTRPCTLRLAARLMEAGVDTDRIYQMLYQNERAERIALQTRAQQSLALLEDNRLATMRVRRADFIETRANVPDTENLINIPLQIRTVEVSLLFTEPLDDGPVRVSLRSKGGVDVAQFAEQFGGGGHARASGLKLSRSFEEAYEVVVAAMSQCLRDQRRR